MFYCVGLLTPIIFREPLGADENGIEYKRNGPNSYASVIGIMLYLSSNKRPGISFVVCQCDPFTHNIKESHETDVKKICWYLQGTKYKCLVLNTSKKILVDCYVKAYFMGQWGHENPQDPICASSRSELVVNFPNFFCCGCQSYKQIVLYLLEISSMLHCLILLETYFH